MDRAADLLDAATLMVDVNSDDRNGSSRPLSSKREKEEYRALTELQRDIVIFFALARVAEYFVTRGVHRSFSYIVGIEDGVGCGAGAVGIVFILF